MDIIATQQQLFNARRLNIAQKLGHLTLRQSNTIYLICIRFLWQLKRNHGNLTAAIHAGEEGKTFVAIALQSRKAVREKDYDGGLQGFVRRIRTEEFWANGSKRKLQEAIADLEEFGALIKHGDGNGYVPHYDASIHDLLLIAEWCEARIAEEIGFEHIPATFHWLAYEFKAVMGSPMNRLQDGERPTVDQEYFAADLEAYKRLFRPSVTVIAELDTIAQQVYRRFCQKRRRSQYEEVSVIYWDVDLSCPF